MPSEADPPEVFPIHYYIVHHSQGVYQFFEELRPTRSLEELGVAYSSVSEIMQHALSQALRGFCGDFDARLNYLLWDPA